MIIADGHVHVHLCFDLGIFLDFALKNFQSAAKQTRSTQKFFPILMLSETFNSNYFAKLKRLVSNKLKINGNNSVWSFHPTSENVSIIARDRNNNTLFLVFGRQIETLEGLEVLALGTDLYFDNGQPIESTIKRIEEDGAIPVLPWGFGKWLGKRGRILRNLLHNAKKESWFLGDNGGRPVFFLKPSLYRLARDYNIRILHGSDPLPFSSEINKAGSFGFSLRESSFSSDYPFSNLKHLLTNSYIKVEPYGDPEKLPHFILNQFRMQIKKRLGFNIPV